MHSSKINLLGKGVFGIFFLLYPFMIFWLSLNTLIYCVIGFTLLRVLFLIAMKKNSLSFQEKNTLYTAMGVCLVIGLIFYSRGDIAALYYPVIVSLGFAVTFALTLIFPPSMIERIARLRTPNLDPKGVTYTKNVTYMWTMFCMTNAFVSFLTILSEDMYIWSLYNGCISYILMGILFAGEYTFRKYHVQKRKGSPS